jgi:hypothetical protein
VKSEEKESEMNNSIRKLILVLLAALAIGTISTGCSTTPETVRPSAQAAAGTAVEQPEGNPWRSEAAPSPWENPWRSDASHGPWRNPWNVDRSGEPSNPWS